MIERAEGYSDEHWDAEVRLIDANAIDVGDISCYYGENCRLSDVQELIDDQPTIEAEPVRHGRWEIIDTDANVWKCTTCGEEWMLNDGNPSDNNMSFCPHCGSRMCGGADNG